MVEIYSPPECRLCKDRAWIDLRKWDLGCWCAGCLSKVVDEGSPRLMVERFLAEDPEHKSTEGTGG